MVLQKGALTKMGKEYDKVAPTKRRCRTGTQKTLQVKRRKRPK